MFKSNLLYKKPPRLNDFITGICVEQLIIFTLGYFSISDCCILNVKVVPRKFLRDRSCYRSFFFNLNSPKLNTAYLEAIRSFSPK